MTSLKPIGWISMIAAILLFGLLVMTGGIALPALSGRAQRMAPKETSASAPEAGRSVPIDAAVPAHLETATFGLG